MNTNSTRLFTSILSMMIKRGASKPTIHQVSKSPFNGVQIVRGNVAPSRTLFAAGFSSYKWPEGFEKQWIRNEEELQVYEEEKIINIPQMLQIEENIKNEEKPIVLLNDPRDYEVFYFGEEKGRRNKKKRKDRRRKI